MARIRVIIVDNSPVVRVRLGQILANDPDLEIVGRAAGEPEALALLQEVHPDVVTVNSVIGGQDALEALRRALATASIPVITVSDGIRQCILAAAEASAASGVDLGNKPIPLSASDAAAIREDLANKIKATVAGRATRPGSASVDATRARFRDIKETVRTGPGNNPVPITNTSPPAIPRRIVAIACSTGGPEALQTLLPALPATLKTGVVIVQHIAPGFSEPLARRLDQLCKLRVREAKDGDAIVPGEILLAPAGLQFTVTRRGQNLVARLSTEPINAPFRPCADVMFSSLAACCPSEVCGVILTGMGNDGSAGLRALHDNGAYTIAQDEASSVVWGMPHAAAEAGGIDVIRPLTSIAAEIARCVGA